MPLFCPTKALGNQFFNEKFVNRLSTKRITPFLFFWERSSRDNAKMKSAYDFWHGFEVLNLSFSSINRADFFFLQLSRFTLLSLPSLPFLWTTANGGLTEKKSRSFDFTRSHTLTKFCVTFLLANSLHIVFAECMCQCLLSDCVWRNFSFLFLSPSISFLLSFRASMNNHNQKNTYLNWTAQRNPLCCWWILNYDTRKFMTQIHTTTRNRKRAQIKIDM